jgi:hypothetical protein
VWGQAGVSDCIFCLQSHVPSEGEARNDNETALYQRKMHTCVPESKAPDNVFVHRPPQSIETVTLPDRPLQAKPVGRYCTAALPGYAISGRLSATTSWSACKVTNQRLFLSCTVLAMAAHFH